MRVPLAGLHDTLSGWVKRFASRYESDWYGLAHPQVPSADQGDASVTFVPGTSKPVLRFNTALTADRTVTLDTVVAQIGDWIRVVRQAGATGAHNLTLKFGTGPTTVKALGSASTWVDVVYDGTNWIETASGSL